MAYFVFPKDMTALLWGDDMDNMFMTVETLESRHRSQFEPIFQSCVDETRIDLDKSIPYYLYNLGQNTGVIGFNIYGDPIGYILYNKQNNHPIFLMHFWVHPNFRRKHVGARMLAHISRAESPRRLMTILHEKLLPAQMFLKSIGFRCTRIIHDAGVTYDQYVFVANFYNPMNRLAVYDPQMF